MTDSHPAMTSSAERRAWSTSGYLIFIAFLVLLVLTVWRFLAMVGGNPTDGEIGWGIVSTGISIVALLILGSLALFAAALDGALSARAGGGAGGVGRPFGEAARLLRQRRRTTVAADSLLWRIGGSGSPRPSNTPGATG